MNYDNDPSKAQPLSALEVFHARRKLHYIPTFSPKLNAVLGGGLREMGTYVLTGGPGAGKTTFTLNVTDFVLGLGYPVVYVGAELPPQLVLDRWAGKKLGLGWLEVVDTEDPATLHAYEQLVNAVENKFWILDPEQSTRWREHTLGIRTHINNMAGFEVPVLLVIDYLQDLAQVMIARGKDPRVAVSELSREIRAFAQQQRCPILIVSSTGRQFYKGDDEVDDSALIASAKEAGEVEYNVNGVFYLRRCKDVATPHTEVVVAKNRFGENPVSVIFSINPTTGDYQETQWASGAQMATAAVMIKVYDLIKKAPGKFATADSIAKTLKIKKVDAAYAIDALAMGVGSYRIVYGNNGTEGYFAIEMAPSTGI